MQFRSLYMQLLWRSKVSAAVTQTHDVLSHEQLFQLLRKSVSHCVPTDSSSLASHRFFSDAATALSKFKIRMRASVSNKVARLLPGFPDFIGRVCSTPSQD